MERDRGISTGAVVAVGAGGITFHEASATPARSTLSRVQVLWRQQALVFMGLVMAVVVLQLLAGAYQAERGNYPDEAAHFLNGLLLRDYIREGLGQNPVAFAEQYYLSYPKIAPAMWPPAFHMALGVFMLSGLPPFVAALLLLALATAWIAWRLFWIVRTDHPIGVAAVMTAMFLLTPMVINLSSAVMVDIFVAVFAIEATVWLATYFQTENWRHAALFGFFSALACLSKGNGVSMVLVAPFMLLLTRKFRLLRQPGLYIAAAIVVAMAVPFLLVSYRLDAAIGDFSPVTASDMLVRLKYYSREFWKQLGPLTMMLALIGFVTYTPKHGGRVRGESYLEPAMKALVLGALAFHEINSHSVYDVRYLTLAIAPLLALVPRGIQNVSSFIGSPDRRVVAQMVVLIVVASGFLVGRPALASRTTFGFRQAVASLDERGLGGRRVLIVSDEGGEGAFVSEVAVRQPNPAPTIIRGSKLLASDNWLGHNFRLLFSSSAELMRELEDLHVDYLVIDKSVDPNYIAYRPQVEELIAAFPDRFEQVQAVKARRAINVYRLNRHSPGPPKKLRISLPNSLGKTLER